MAFVLDASVALAWCFPDESNAYADVVLQRFKSETAMVPTIWPLEVANALVVGVRRSRLTPEHMATMAQLIQELPIDIDPIRVAGIFDEVVRIATTYALSVYDATYLELAQRLRSPLATVDVRLADAARRLQVAIV